MSTNSTIVFITGGNTGLGYEAIKALCKSNNAYTILLGCRSVSKGEAAIKSLQSEVPNSKSTISPIQADVESDDSIQAASDTISKEYGKVDVLINNAGAGFDGEMQDGKMSLREGWNRAYNINVTGTHIMTSTFVPLLLKSSAPRLLFITSGTSSLIQTEKFDNPALARINASPPAGWPKATGPNPIASYRSSKTGMYANSWVEWLLGHVGATWICDKRVTQIDAKHGVSTDRIAFLTLPSLDFKTLADHSTHLF